MFNVIKEKKNIGVFEDDELFVFFNPDNLEIGYTSKSAVDLKEIEMQFVNSTKTAKKDRKHNNLMLRLLITSRCNLNCSYCQMKKLTKEHSESNMKKDTIIDLLKYIKAGQYDYVTIHFSGGEPLVAKEIIQFTCEEVEKMQIKNVRFAISTNGLLLTDAVVDMLVKYDVQTVVSIDGMDENVTERRDYSGAPTVKRVLQVCDRAQKKGLNIGISTVFTKDNKDSSVDFIRTLYNKYGIKSVGFNYQHYSGFEKNNVDVSEEYMSIYAKILNEISGYCRENNIFEEQSNRILEPFALSVPRKTHCSSQSSQITVMPDGLLGPCKTFVSDEKDCISIDVFLNNNKLKNDIFEKWHGRVVENIEKCSSCIFRGLCGGGCPYEAYVDHGNIYFPDNRYCIVPRTIFHGLLDFLKENGTFRNASSTLQFLADEDRKIVLTCKNSNRYKLTASIGHFMDE